MPNKRLTYKRGEIWWVDLDPKVGDEVGKTRPCVILQNDVGNKMGGTTIVAPLGKGAANFPFVVNITKTPQNGLDMDRYIDLGQMRAVAHQRVKSICGILEETYWDEIEKAVLIELGFDAVFK